MKKKKRKEKKKEVSSERRVEFPLGLLFREVFRFRWNRLQHRIENTRTEVRRIQQQYEPKITKSPKQTKLEALRDRIIEKSESSYIV